MMAGPMACRRDVAVEPSAAQVRAIRAELRKEIVPPSMPLAEQRRAWIDHARTQSLAPGTTDAREVIAGVPCLWVRADGAVGNGTILYLHGGGLVDGAAVTHRELASRLARTTGRAVLLADYRLLPEHPPSAPLEDAMRVYRALLRERHHDPRAMAIGGDSSGGGLALSALLTLRDAGDPLPARAFTISGAFDATLSGPTIQTLSVRDPILSYEVLKDWQERYLPAAALSEVSLSPLFGNLSGLPPMLLLAGSDEVWLSDSTRLADRIRRAGGTVTLRVWQGMWHAWPMDGRLPQAQAALEEIREFLR
jgi:monoterpene epsilon-lactone hydrolase